MTAKTLAEELREWANMASVSHNTSTRPIVLLRQAADELDAIGGDRHATVPAIVATFLRERAEAAESLAARYGKALERIRNYENGLKNHTSDCELRQYIGEPDDMEDDVICSCGYWSIGFIMLKLEARDALKGDPDA